MQIEHLPLDAIKPYPKNPRKNKKGISAVKRSIEEFGFTQPIIVNAERIILCGHTRYEAAKELNLATVPVITKSDLTPQQERAYRILYRHGGSPRRRGHRSVSAKCRNSPRDIK